MMLGSLTSLTGGGGLQGGMAGPATSGTSGNTTNNSGFEGGHISIGESKGMPWWFIVLMALFALYALSKR
ncbi:GlyGly-CTERM sorting domain-containing protein [Vibrio crassostreae]|nr:GlyGly-CTERM sorting domain-containing protein [Vibrio crassostreae]CAK3981327.1 GlyGly-CTERM sorting domain-containing protein [Vibrio crassostreae]CDT46043.1 conserved exported hypothetical protein [Vibrio coralliirubri]